MNTGEHAKLKICTNLAYQVVFLTLLAILTYFGGIILLAKPINYYMPNWFFNPICFLSILIFDTIWIVWMKLWHPKSSTINIIRKILSVFVLAFSASILTHWSILNILHGIMH
jgi:uncharacterized membrane protein